MRVDEAIGRFQEQAAKLLRSDQEAAGVEVGEEEQDAPDAIEGFVRFDNSPKVESSATLSHVVGDGLREATVRQLAYFLIQAVTTEGKRSTSGGERFNVSVRGPSKTRAKVTDNSNGTYLVAWRPHCSGPYSITVTLGGELLPGSPHLVHVTNSLPCASKCEVSGKALAEAVSRVPQTFEIRFRDRFAARVEQQQLQARAAGPMGKWLAGPLSEWAYAIDQGPGSADEARDAAVENEPGEIRYRTIRVRVGEKPLILRTAPAKGSAPIGRLLPGQVVTVLEEHISADGEAPTAAAAEMTATSEVSRSSSGAKYGAFSAKDAKYGTFSAKTAEGGTEVRCFTEDGLVAAPGMETTVTDLKDGTYTIRWRSKFSGKFRASVQIGDEDVRGSPVQIALVSSTPELNKSELSGGGLTGAVAGERSHFRIKFVDAFGNIALPGPSLKFGLVLEKERQKLTAATESMQFEGVWEKGDTGVYKIQFVAKAAGSCSLHVWCDLEPHPGERTRTAFPGSPFSFVVVAGPASAAVSRVDGWSKVSKEERSVGGKKSVDMAALDNATIVAGDSLSIRPQIYDSWGNPTSRGGQTTYDIRYDAHLAGTHQMYIKLDGQHIIGSPLSFYVQPDRPEPTLCKLHPPPDPLYPDLPHVFTLVTFDRFHNKCVTGGLILTNRLQIIKQNVHDQTALMPNNHSFVTVDQGDGTYHLILQTIMPCSLRLMVNLDKNLGNNSGELPGLMVQVVPDLERPDSGRGSDGSGSPLTSNQKNAASFSKGIRSRQSTGELSKLTPVKQADDSGSSSNESSSKGDDSAGDSGGTISAFGSGIISAFGSGASSIKGSGTERLQKGVKAVMLGFGGSEQRRKKDALLMAVEVFVDGHGAIDSDHSKTAPNPDLFERATSSASSERRVRIESR
ncbi:gelation factor [Chrysochromulina tobinii]|uniref:Gelation factor n=1 Tax=Chrysochromulina tobinii TaxID=1460289 RepID=A0A0M0JIZ9_9EUKA|nr:gelation factor [Chrysochromulina tobinii]|eukprot:KOO26218.1 gelation factor [Chrysochromulina sp. CCMP291]